MSVSVRRFPFVVAALVAAGAAVSAPPAVVLQPFASGFNLPVEITHARDGSGRLFVVEQGGRIRVVRGGALLARPFLDLTGIVLSGGEQGLLGLAFHPGYATNGRFFVYYNRPVSPANGGSEIVIAAYRVSAQDPDVADPAGTELLVIPHPTFGNHNGGKLAFRPGDSALYAGVGDGGGAGNQLGTARNLGELRGKLLRLDVDHAPADLSANPFFSRAGARPEVYAYGLRNPYRFSFDRANGDLFIGDVGQDAWEEIDYAPFAAGGGEDFGWNVFEGTHCFNPPTGCALAAATAPILEYGHDANGGFAVTGGVRYRGPVRELYGWYIYGDYVSGRTWAAQPDANGSWGTTLIASLPNVSTFGEDEAGELYATNHLAGTIVRIAVPDADGDGMSDAFEALHFGSATAGDPARDDDGDGLTNLVEYREGRNPLVKDNDVFGDARLFAMQQYRDFLSREGDPSGIDFWTRQVASGASSRAQAIQLFFDSPEFAASIAPVVRLYLAAFVRVPDYAGLQFWLGQSRGGVPLGDIAESFARSPEFVATYGVLDDAGFIDRLYLNVLGRSADAPGRAFWLSQVAGGMTRGGVLLSFSESPEFQAASRSSVLATTTYVGMLRRTPEAGGYAFWRAFIDAGNAETSLIASFFAAPEYRARFLP